jgi:hypothetical protein
MKRLRELIFDESLSKEEEQDDDDLEMVVSMILNIPMQNSSRASGPGPNKPEAGNLGSILALPDHRA